MKPTSPLFAQRPRNKRRGSAIAITMILMLGASLIMGSILRFSANERRLNQRQRLWLEAKFAAESLAEYGFADLRKRFDSNNAFPEDGLMPTNNPVWLPTRVYDIFDPNTTSYWWKTNVKLPDETAYEALRTAGTYPAWGTYDTEIIAGIVPKGVWTYIDPNIPGNETDKLKGRTVFARGIALYAKATVRDPVSGKEESAYCHQILQVRDAPLFSHAIFYNMTMEIAPGPRMDVRGAVHVNGDLYVQAGNQLNFYDQVTIAGKLYHGRHPDSGKSDSYNPVNFIDASSTLRSMESGGTWLDSDVADFVDLASARWQGNLMTSGHHVESKLLLEIPDYVDDDPSTAAVDDALNYGYEIITKARNLNDTNYSKTREEQKFSYKAGLTIKVDTTGNTVSFVTYQRDANGNLLYDAGTGAPLTTTLTPTSTFATVDLFSSSGSGSSETVTGGLRDKRRANKGIDLVEVDMGALRTLVHNNDATEWGGSTAQKPENWWNGVVFVEFPETGTAGADAIASAPDYWGVKLHNGKQIPNPTFAHSDSVYGTSLATNNVMYVEGHYNADGDSSTGTANDPDNTDVTVEPPAALAADAINILSSNWDDSKSGRPKGERTGSFTEFSAAILTGLTPSGKGGSNSYSGGTENFPRFLEQWGATLRMRGSVVSLFESEIATEPWGSSDVYSAPTRDWGFHSQLAKGYYPPGTPNTRTYRRLDYKDMTETEFNAEIAALKTYISTP